MKQESAFAYIYDFISILIEKNEIMLLINKIILFGSVARGNFDKDSDIDLFIELKNREDKGKVERIARYALNEFEIKAEKTWNLKKINFPIKYVTGILEETEWAELRNELASTGIVLYGAYEQSPKEVQHCAIVSYDLSRLKQHKKMQLLRELYGYKNKKGRKLYEQKGVLEKTKGIKMAQNQFIIKISELKEMLKILDNFKTQYKIREAWIK